MIDALRQAFYPKFAVKLLCTHATSVLLYAPNSTRDACIRLVKIALKYGVAVTLVIAAWVALKHFVLHLQGAPAQSADLVVFNFTAIVGLMLGIKERRAANSDSLTFWQGLKTGISIAVTYAILTSLYFAVLLAVVGPKLTQQEGETTMAKA